VRIAVKFRIVLLLVFLVVSPSITQPPAQPPAPTHAQPPASTPAPPQASAAIAFDVVTVTRDKSVTGQPSIESPQDGDSVIIRNMPLRMILSFAFGLVRYNSIDGLPPWADTERFDLTAKVAAADLPAFHQLLPRQRNPMLRPLLASQFHLQSHFESRLMPAYALELAKGGTKISAVQPGLTPDGRTDPGGIRMGPTEIVSTAAPLAPLLDALSVQLGRPVVDRTGLTGRYSFTIHFAPVQSAADAQPDAAPSLFTALQEQLGLKLESTRAPASILVIDHIEHPSEN
jgi:uncharacterized protein (TIGR03435 family)